MKSHWFNILLAVAEGAKHGAEIRRWIQTRTDSAELYPAMLYGSLEDLLEQGWLAEARDREELKAPNRRRRTYRITRAGRRALAEESSRLRRLTRLAESVLERLT